MKNRFKPYNKLLCLVLTFLFLLGCSEQPQSPDEKILLRGDLHVHTKYSADGVHSVEDTAKYSKMSGYDFIALTDHNISLQNYDQYKDDTLIIISGMENTLPQGIGHSNIIGVPDIKKSDTWAYKIDELHKMGGYFQINHPFDDKLFWGQGFDVKFDWLEIWNGAWNQADVKAMDWWQAELSKGKKVIGTSGSDAHKQKEGRLPFNCVYVTERSATAILEAINKGNLYVSVSSKGPDIIFYCNNAIMGDTVKFNRGKKLNLEISNLVSGDIVEIYTDKGIDYTQKITEKSFKREWKMEDRLFYRVVVRREDKIVSFSNPIYIDKNK